MKRLLLFLFLGFSATAFSQLKDTLEAEKFWADNIPNLVSLNKKRIIEQTHFPLSIYFETETKKLTKEQFEKSLDGYFNQELRDELSKMDINDIDAWGMPGEPQTYMLVSYKGIQGYDAMVISFFQYNGIWMLDHLSYQND